MLCIRVHCPAIIRKLKGSWHKQLGNTLITRQVSRSRTDYSSDSAVHPQELDSTPLSLSFFSFLFFFFFFFAEVAEPSLLAESMMLWQFQSSDPHTVHTYRKKKGLFFFIPFRNKFFSSGDPLVDFSKLGPITVSRFDTPEADLLLVSGHPWRSWLQEVQNKPENNFRFCDHKRVEIG